MKKEKISVFIATHKKPLFKMHKKGYHYISVGGNYRDAINDDGEDSISHLNKYFSELTATYWIWKHCDSDYVGLFHYRRFFGCKKGIVSTKTMISFLKAKQILLVQPLNFGDKTTFQHYCTYRKSDELEEAKKVIGILFPEYLQEWDAVMNKNCAHLFNILVTSKSIFDSYSYFLFSVLFEINRRFEKRKRMLGYIGEYLLDLFIEHNKYSYLELPLLFKQPVVERVANKILRVIKR